MQNSPFVIWITGLSGAGKTTLALDLIAKLKLSGRPAILLDGDVLREVLALNNDKEDSFYTKEARLGLSKRYSRLCRMLSDQGFNVVIATISLFHEIHALNRKNLPGYVEVYLEVPTHILRQRDSKGLYQSFELGKIKNVVGCHELIEFPLKPDLLFRWSDNSSLDYMSSKILSFIEG